MYRSKTVGNTILNDNFKTILKRNSFSTAGLCLLTGSFHRRQAKFNFGEQKWRSITASCKCNLSVCLVVGIPSLMSASDGVVSKERRLTGLSRVKILSASALGNVSKLSPSAVYFV